MNTLRKMRKNAKALSPVVASIILIAVTVAVSIAVAAWMGALVIGQMNTEQIKITGISFNDDGTMSIAVINQGTNGVTIADVAVNGELLAVTYDPDSSTIGANGQATLTGSYDWTLGYSYQVEIITTQGNHFFYTAVA